MTKQKKSFGIALCTINNGVFKILMIKKRYTYQFFEFVHGKYKKNDNKHIMNLLNNMTYHEKLLINKLKFGDMWSMIWDYNPDKHISDIGKSSKKGLNNYFRKKTKFDSTFLLNSGSRIKNLIDNSSNSETPWEIPKGHKRSFETDMDSAIREFKEETNIGIKDYKIFWHINPICESHKDQNVFYKNTYYVAELSKNKLNWHPKVFFNNKTQIIEIECIKWVSLDEIKFLQLNKKTYDRTIKLFKKIKKKYMKNR